MTKSGGAPGFMSRRLLCFPEFIIDLLNLLDKQGGKKLAKIEYWISGRGRQRRWTLVTLNSKRYNDDEVIYEKGIQCHH
jgi:hypothetical protein